MSKATHASKPGTGNATLPKPKAKSVSVSCSTATPSNRSLRSQTSLRSASNTFLPLFPEKSEAKLVKITVEGPIALGQTIPREILDQTMAFDDPTCKHNTAFQTGRWDGKKRLYSGQVFPAGFVPKVKRALGKAGYTCEVVRDPAEQIDTSNFGPGYLHGVTLRPDQVMAVEALLKHGGGRLGAPTASGKTYIAASIAKYLWFEKGWRTLIITSRKGLVKKQVRVTQQVVGDDPVVGQFGDGVKTYGPIVCATGQALVRFRDRKTPKGWIKADPRIIKLLSYECILMDECHHGQSETYYDFCMSSTAKMICGMSGTVDQDKEIEEARLEGVCGPVVHRVAQTGLVDQGSIKQVKVVAVMTEKASGPELPGEYITWDRADGSTGGGVYPVQYQEAYRQGVVENDTHNRSVVAASQWLVKQGRRPLVLCRRKEHFTRLLTALRKAQLKVGSVWGDTPTEERDRVYKSFQSGNEDILIGSCVLDEGEDIPAIDSIVLAEGVKDSKSIIQRVGRGRRMETGGPDTVWVVLFVSTCHPRLMEHGLIQVQTCEAQGWDVELCEDFDPARPALPFLTRGKPRHV